MSGYYIDTHVHTNEVSPCGKVPAQTMIRLYKAAGYAAVCVTDHYFKGYFEKMGDIPWKEKGERYCRGYFTARELGEKLGIRVYFGQEMRFYDHANDFLVYGISPEDLLANPELYNMTLDTYRGFAHAHGAVIFQAHPFRTPPCAPANPAWLDGVEVYNGHPDHNSRNALAQQFSEMCHLPASSGSDFHRPHHLARGGIIVSHMPRDEKELGRMLVTHEGILSLVKTPGGMGNDPA